MGLIVKTAVKDKAQGFQISADFVDAFEAKVETLLRDAMHRAEANGRKTLMAKDL